MTLPLAGVRVLDLTRVLAGPFCTMMLGDLGAEVVKVEPPGTGDETRTWGPPFQEGESTYFLAVNRNKRSVALDLKQDGGREAARRLAARADVVVENFRPGVVDRLGLDGRTLTQAHPALVYCSISAFGQDGPGRDRPGYDLVIQAESGLMSVTGEADGPPVKVGIAIADILTGMNAATAIVSALYARPARGGRGGIIDAALYDTLVAFLSTLVPGYTATGQVPGRWGSAHPQIVPYQAFRAADGDLVVCVTNEKFWRSLCALLERPDLAADPRFATNPDRVAHRSALVPLLEAAFQRRHRRGPGRPTRRVADQRSDRHVVEDRQAREGPHELERPRHAEPANLVGRPAGQVHLAEADPPAVGPHEAGKDAEERRLARAVRADEADDLPRRDDEVDAGQGGESAEPLHDPPRLERGPARGARVQGGIRRAPHAAAPVARSPATCARP